MNVFDSYTHELLLTLNKEQVEYLVVGGYAVNYHGYRRTTGDIDLWIKPENGENKERILRSLHRLKVSESKLKQLKALDFTKHVVFIDGEEPFKIDFMTQVSGVNFDDAWKQKIIANIDDLNIPFLHLSDLIVSKITTGRNKDKIDIEELQKIQMRKK